MIEEQHCQSAIWGGEAVPSRSPRWNRRLFLTTLAGVALAPSAAAQVESQPDDKQPPAPRGGASAAAPAPSQQPESKNEKSVIIDRVAVRFSVPEGAGRERPYFIYERELSFQARLVALSDATFRSKVDPYRRHHLQAALERHIAETLLAALKVDPALSEKEISVQLEAAQEMTFDSVGGAMRFAKAADAEGIGNLEVRGLFRRRALASLYLHKMVAPMLAPSMLELRRTHRRGEGPLADKPFAEAEPALRLWYIERSLRAAVASYYQNARARLRIEFL